MKLSEAIILGRSLVDNDSYIWNRCALGGAVLSTTGQICSGYNHVERTFPRLEARLATLIIRMFDNGQHTIEQIADFVRENGDCDSVNYSDTRNPSLLTSDTNVVQCKDETLSPVR